MNRWWIIKRTTYEDNVGDFSNWRGGLRLLYRFTPHFEGFFQYVHTARDYNQELYDPELDELYENFHVYDPSAGVSWQFSQEFAVNGWAGYFLQNNDESKNLGGYYVGVNLNWEKSDLYGVNLEASNGYDRADLNSENLGLTRYVRVSVGGTYTFARHFSGLASVFYRENEYLQTVGDRKDRFYGGQVGVEYQIFQWMFVSLTIGHNRVNSTDPGQDYSENRGTLRVTLEPEKAWRWIF